MKYIFSLLVLSSLCGHLSAQRSSFYFLRGKYSIPVNENISSLYRYGYGGEIGGGLGFDDTFFQLSLGYDQFQTKETVTTGALTIIPLRAAIRQYVVPDIVYLHAGGGIAWMKNRTITSEVGFNVSAGVGVQVSVVEIEAAYEGVNNKKPIGWGSWIGLKLGVILFDHQKRN